MTNLLKLKYTQNYSEYKQIETPFLRCMEKDSIYSIIELMEMTEFPIRALSDKSIKFNITRNNTTIVFNQYVSLHQQNQIDEPTKYCGFYGLIYASILHRNARNEAKDRLLFKSNLNRYNR